MGNRPVNVTYTECLRTPASERNWDSRENGGAVSHAGSKVVIFDLH